tara:strand:+ start:221 stop:397 length:177 start_codon:yes stop_codon:yes gene_type:complete
LIYNGWCKCHTTKEKHFKEWRGFMANLVFAMSKRMKGEFSKEDYSNYMNDIIEMGEKC